MLIIAAAICSCVAYLTGAAIEIMRPNGVPAPCRPQHLEDRQPFVIFYTQNNVLRKRSF